MIEIRFHGEDDMDALTSAELTAAAAIQYGQYAVAGQVNGVRPGGKHGATATAYVRVSDNPIQADEGANSPDVVVILDQNLLGGRNLLDGLKPEGLVILNSTQSPSEVRKQTGIKSRLAVVDASETALEVMHVPVNDTNVLRTLIMAPRTLAPEACMC